MCRLSPFQDYTKSKSLAGWRRFQKIFSFANWPVECASEASLQAEEEQFRGIGTGVLEKSAFSISEMVKNDNSFRDCRNPMIFFDVFFL